MSAQKADNQPNTVRRLTFAHDQGFLLIAENVPTKKLMSKPAQPNISSRVS